MTLRAFLHERLGYDATYAQAAIVVLCGVILEMLALILVDGISSGRLSLRLVRDMGPEALFFFATAGAYLLVTASLGYGLTFAACGSLDLRPWLKRVIALTVAPLGVSLVTATLLWLVTRSEGDFAPDLAQVIYMPSLSAYAVLGLPLLAAALLSARKIKKSRVNAEAVFGGTS